MTLVRRTSFKDTLDLELSCDTLSNNMNVCIICVTLVFINNSTRLIYSVANAVHSYKFFYLTGKSVILAESWILILFNNLCHYIYAMHVYSVVSKHLVFCFSAVHRQRKYFYSVYRRGVHWRTRLHLYILRILSISDRKKANNIIDLD